MRRYRNIIKNSSKYLLPLIFLFITTLCYADKSLEVTSSVDSDVIGLEDYLYFTVKVTGSDLSDVPAPEIPDIKGFSVLGSSRSTSRQFQIIGNRTESTISHNYTYTLKPTKKGTFTLPTTQIKYKNATYKTKSIKVEVKEGSVKKQPRGRRNIFDSVFDDDDFFRSPFDRRTAPEEIKDEIILEKMPRTAEVYTGEPLIVNTYLYAYGVNVNSISESSTPSLDGFWIEEETVHPSSTRVQVKRNNRLYTRFTLRTRILFPTKRGIFNINPTIFEMRVSRRGFGIGSFGQRIHRKTNPVTIHVIPLPERGMPADFSGAVGDFKIKCELDKNTVKAGEAVNLKITYSGTGNMRNITPPQLEKRENFTVYGPELEQDLALRGDTWGGSKTWNYILIPKETGVKEIGPFTFSYFNPEKKRYETVKTEKYSLNVEEGESEDAAPYPAGRPVTARRQDINYLREINGKIKDESTLLLERPLAWILLLVPILLNLGIFGFNFVQSHRKINIAKYRSKSAASNALKMINRASRAAHKESTEKGFDLLIKAVAGYFADKWNTEAGSLTIDKIRRDLKKINPELTDEVNDFFEDCEYQRFAGSRAADKSTMAKNTHQAKVLIKKLEKLL